MNINSSLQTLSQWVPFFSLLFALIALGLSYLSFKTAKKSFLLSVEQDRRTKPSLDLYIVDSFILPAAPPVPRIFVFQVRITNTSDAPNSLRELQLIIEHGKNRGVLSNVAIPHNADLLKHLKSFQNIPLSIPCSIAARSVLGGVAVFSIPDDLTKNSVIESYTVEVVDTFGLKAGTEAIILKELPDESLENGNVPDQK